mgnify:CR=1 FL=1
MVSVKLKRMYICEIMWLDYKAHSSCPLLLPLEPNMKKKRKEKDKNLENLCSTILFRLVSFSCMLIFSLNVSYADASGAANDVYEFVSANCHYHAG